MSKSLEKLSLNPFLLVLVYIKKKRKSVPEVKRTVASWAKVFPLPVGAPQKTFSPESNRAMVSTWCLNKVLGTAYCSVMVFQESMMSWQTFIVKLSLKYMEL